MIGIMVLLMVVNVVVGGAYAYFHWRLGQIKRVDLPSLSRGDDGVTNVLLVGSDSREGFVTDEPEAPRGQRTDTIMILHVRPDQQKAAILSIPRDLYVPLAGTNRSDRINAAFGLGGPEPLIRTIQGALGIEIDHYVEVDFVGFQNLVDAIGGVTVYNPVPARDDYSGLEIGHLGCVTLNGYQALALVRSRHYETLEGGTWQLDASGDIGRIERQQHFIRLAMRQAISKGMTNPVTLNRLIGIGVEFVTLDRGLSTGQLTELAKRFSNLDPERVEMFTLPATSADVDGASVLLLDEPAARGVINGLQGKAEEQANAAPPAAAPAGPQPADVRVRALNGNGVPQVANQAGSELERLGYSVVERADADAPTYSRTLVRFAPGQQAKAELVQRSLTAGADLQEDPSLQGADVALVLGQDYRGVTASGGPSGGAPGAAPTTSVAPDSASPTTQPSC